MPKTTQYQRNAAFISRKIVEETVLVPIHNNVADMNCIYTLNELGAFIWEQLEQPCTQARLNEVVLAAYDANPEILQQDISQFLAEMTEIGAIQKG